jgi:hypothetical protein
MRQNERVVACLLALTLGATGCIASDSEVLDVSEGCDEYADGEIESLELDADAKAFVQASADVDAATVRISESVLTACAGIAQDLGEADTWSGLDELKQKISNAEESGACDAAARAIQAKLAASDGASASLRVAVAKGECHIDYEKQQACDADCAANPTCVPGPIETRCEPARISAVCMGSCEVSAYCIGSASVSAHCEGSCEGGCAGECKGTCHREDGSAVENDPNCQGKCDGQLVGECFGHCKVEASAGIECGKDVRCQGGCSGELVAPACTTEYGPPTCEVNTVCYEACKTRIAEEAVCEPSTVKIVLTVAHTPELDALKATLETHLPALYDAAENEGLLIKQASSRMADAGNNLADHVKDLNGKSVACVTTSTSALADRVSTLEVSAKACAKVQGTVEIK